MSPDKPPTAHPMRALTKCAASMVPVARFGCSIQLAPPSAL
jgi:hypothetical protein